MAKNPYDPEEMRARLAEIDALIPPIDEELAPLQEEAAEIGNYKRDREVELNGLIKEANARRGALMNEKSVLIRALGGRTMSDGGVGDVEVEE